jgi:ABC-2 type transport system ATP-binding protein
MIIETLQVEKKFGDFSAIRNISLRVEAGEVVGFVGANGAGKTTTISTLLGFISPTSGEIRLFGKPLQAASAHIFHKRMGYAAGDMELPPRLTGAQYLQFVRSRSGKNHDKLFDDLCQRFKPELHKKIKDLSRGNKQKIALIGAFVTDPELIVLDEPTSGLDPVMQAVFLQLVREAQAKGKTIFMSSHYLNEVADVCSRVILMRSGEIIRDISASEMLQASGKQVRVVVSQKHLAPPKGATEIKSEIAQGKHVVSFAFTGGVGELQRWLGTIKQLEDIEITEYNLEAAFKDMYVGEETKQ